MSYTKSTALAIKGDYSKNIDLPADDRYTSTTMKYYQKPLVRQEGEFLNYNRWNYEYNLKERWPNNSRPSKYDFRYIKYVK
jgi:hypothetical protein